MERTRPMLNYLQLVIGVAVVLVLLTSCEEKRSPSGFVTTETIHMLSLQRIKAEQQVILLKEDRQRGLVNAQKYDSVRRLYDDSEAYFNSWFFAFTFCLRSNQDPRENSECREKLNEAFNKSEQFLAAAKKIHKSAVRLEGEYETRRNSQDRLGYTGGTLVDIGEVLEGLTGAAVKVWESYQKANEAEQQQII